MVLPLTNGKDLFYNKKKELRTDKDERGRKEGRKKRERKSRAIRKGQMKQGHKGVYILIRKCRGEKGALNFFFSKMSECQFLLLNRLNERSLGFLYAV